jgi:hypothetical protein
MELSTELNMSIENLEPIVKNLIQKQLIKADYDEISRGIQFKMLVEEIDALLQLYRDWEEQKKGKKL